MYKVYFFKSNLEKKFLEGGGDTQGLSTLASQSPGWRGTVQDHRDVVRAHPQGSPLRPELGH